MFWQLVFCFCFLFVYIFSNMSPSSTEYSRDSSPNSARDRIVQQGLAAAGLIRPDFMNSGPTYVQGGSSAAAAGAQYGYGVRATPGAGLSSASPAYRAPTVTPRTEHTPAAVATPTANLTTSLASSFANFHGGLEAERRQRKMAEVQRRNEVEERIARLEKAVELEASRRAEADSALQMHLEKNLAKVEERVARAVNDAMSAVRTDVAAMAGNIDALRSAIEEERADRQADAARASAEHASSVDEVRTEMHDERVSRLEREAAMLKRIGEDIYSVAEKVDSERIVREQAVSEVLEHMRMIAPAAMNPSKRVEEERWQAHVLTEIADLKARLSAERDERLAEDEAIVAAVNSYTHALQEGLHIVNS